MRYELTKGQDGILRVAFIGDIDQETAETYRKDGLNFLDATKGDKLHKLVDARREGKFSGGARRTVTQLNADPRLDKSAVCNINRFNRVMATFIMKATGRNNIRFLPLR